MNEQLKSPSTTSPSTTSTTPRLVRVLALAASGALLAGAVGVGIWSGAGAASPASANAVVQHELDGLVDLGFPAALASVTAPDGGHDDYVAGLGDVESGEPVPVDGEVRVGSNTKTYTAVVVLQLVDEGLIELDAPIERYLPGLVRGDGIDGADITVRQLLQHTTGLPDYTDGIAVDIDKLQHAYREPRDLLDLALAEPAQFAPGEKWDYSNTNYLLLGILIERLTQRPVYEQVTERIIEPLGLTETYFPYPGEQEFRGEHPNGYHDGEDVSVLDPAFGWAAGALIASPSDINEFFRAVLDGRLLSDAMLTEMQKTVPSDETLWPGARYGLGLERYPLSCGEVVWGHGGDIHGFQTRNGVAEDGTAYAVAVTSLPWGFIDPEDEEPLLEAYHAVTDSVDAAFCGAEAG
jgi:D-alanyl-D-alanine carboxypeptidase